MRPKILDLFCGAGGCSMGYYQAGLIPVGVDIAEQPNYPPFRFAQLDAILLLESLLEGEMFYTGRWGWALSDFSAIHASPPCQAYTTMANRHGRSEYALIDRVRELLRETELPYVIENVPGAKSHMRSPIELTGEMFGLRVHRPRLFESNVLLLAPSRPSRQDDPVAVYGANDQRRLYTRKDGSELHAATLEDARAGMGIDWMDWDEIKEAIPPAYTEHIGLQLIYHLNAASSTREDAQSTRRAD